MLLETDPEKYQDFIIREVHNKVLCPRAWKKLCGMLIDVILYCDKFRKDA